MESLKGVNDRDYYVNSFHVDVKEPITIVEKIKREAPFHALTRGGHITYVELDGEAQKKRKGHCEDCKGDARRADWIRFYQSPGRYLSRLWLQGSHLQPLSGVQQ